MPDRHGPLRTGRFTVELDDVEVPGWQSVTIPSSTTEKGEYREGPDPDHARKIWGRTSYGDLEMERGVQQGDTRIYDWVQAVINGQVDEARKEIAVILLDEEGQPQIRWEFTNAWPSEYSPPELNSGDDADVATESIVVAFDTMVRTQ